MSVIDLFGVDRNEPPVALPPKTWVPSCLVDEITPLPRASVNQWVKRDRHGFYLDDDDAFGSENETIGLVDGTVVKFSWVIDHGVVTVSALEGDTVSVSRAIPLQDDAYLVFYLESDFEQSAGSLEDLRETCELGVGDEIHVIAWGRSDTPFVFRDGGFHPVDESPTPKSEAE